MAKDGKVEKVVPSTVFARTRVKVLFPRPTRTKQSFRDECDVNKIIAQFKRTGTIGHVSGKKGTYGDAGAYGNSYLDIQNVVAKAKSAFAVLPEKVKERFKGNVALYLEFLGDSKNRDEAIKLGLLKAPVAPEAPKIDSKGPVVDPKAEKAKE